MDIDQLLNSTSYRNTRARCRSNTLKSIIKQTLEYENRL